MAALILLQVAGGVVLDELPKRSALRSFAFDAHQSVGVLVLALVVLRILWRATHATPADSGPAWQRFAARATHRGLYALMLAVPLAGYAMVDAKGYDVAAFGFDAPDFLSANERLAEALGEVHEMLAWTLATLIGLHVAAALWHRFALHDDVLARMLSAR